MSVNDRLPATGPFRLSARWPKTAKLPNPGYSSGASKLPTTAEVQKSAYDSLNDLRASAS